MCGIAGLVDPAVPAAPMRRIVSLMTDTLVHRGPDDEGLYVAHGVGLGMRRLSIIDVAGGQQPIANEDGSVQVVFNGEIYNYLELRKELSRRGHVFRTNSDTEVIAHLYEEKGVETFADLRGMFAVALWDQRARRLVLARDRMGKKPLFYAQRGNTLLFGSEIKAILAADPTLAEPDVDSLAPYLQYGVVPEPRTMFRHVRKLQTGHWLVHEGGETTVAPYWRLEFIDDEASAPSRQQVIEELDRLLEEAVRIRLMSEVPLGIFLSGGLDSSTLVAYAHKAGLRPIKTFTIGFDRRAWDESADAEVVARHFGTDHHVLTLREQDLADDLPDTVLTLVRHFDEPFGDSSALPTYYVSKLAREHVTVILSGDGGDELFAGYTAYKGLRFAHHYQRVPQWLGRRHFPDIVEHGARWLPPGRRYGALRIARVLRDSELPFERRYLLKGSLCRPDLFRQLLTDDAAMRLSRSGTAPLCRRHRQGRAIGHVRGEQDQLPRAASGARRRHARQSRSHEHGALVGGALAAARSSAGRVRDTPAGVNEASRLGNEGDSQRYRPTLSATGDHAQTEAGLFGPAARVAQKRLERDDRRLSRG